MVENVGDPVERGAIIAEVDTDKGVIEVEVFTGGVIENFLVEAGEKVPVGAVLAIIKENEKVAEMIEPVNLPPDNRFLPPPLPAADLQTGRTAETIWIHASPVAKDLLKNSASSLLRSKGEVRTGESSAKMSNHQRKRPKN